MSPLSPNTQAILLLTAPLLTGARSSGEDLLTPREYKGLAQQLRKLGKQPADMLQPDARELLEQCGSVIDASRLERLLGRGFLLGQAVEDWQTRSIWVISRADEQYPRRLKTLLKEDAPIILYGSGDPALLNRGGLAVVGSRNVDEALLDYTRGIGRLAARADVAIVSGGAKGIDQASMQGVLDGGGVCLGVLADSLAKTAVRREYREGLMSGRLVLVSPYDPRAGFNVGHAMQRNKVIYAFAQAALVVSSDWKKGGTWAGAVEQLEKFRFGPVYVRTTGAQQKGLEALREMGAAAWSEPDSTSRLLDLLRGAEAPAAKTPVPTQLTFEATRPLVARDVEEKPALPASLADELFDVVRSLALRLLKTPCTEQQVADSLDVPTPLARAWLSRLEQEGVVERATTGSFSLRRAPAGSDTSGPG